MKFTFKRPQTSKSVGQFYRDRYLEKSAPVIEAPTSQETHLANRRWEQAADKINKEMVLQRVLHRNNEPFRLLSKLGTRAYNSQPKLENKPAAQLRIRTASREKKKMETMKESRFAKEGEEDPPLALDRTTSGLNESKLKRKKRGEGFKQQGAPLER